MILHDTDFISSVKAVMSEDLMKSGNHSDIIFVIRNPGAISYSFLNCLSLSSVLAKIDALPAYFIFYPLLRAVEYYQLSWQRKLTSVKRSSKLTFGALSLRQCSDKGLTPKRLKRRNVSFETLYIGQFTLSTQLMIPNYPVILSFRDSTTVSSKSYPL